MKARNLIVTLSLVFWLNSNLQAGEPIPLGYERWSNTPVTSGAVFSTDPASLLGVYADQWNLIGPVRPSCGRRLIDIDIYYDPNSKKYLSNAIWIENAGDYKTTSYLVHNVSKADVEMIASIKSLVILDIESYNHSAFSTAYTLIVRSNPVRFATKVLISASYDELQSYLANSQWRPIDIDVHQSPGEYVKFPSNYDENMNFYDAVFVSTQQLSNRRTTYVAFGTRDDINAANNYGQVVDVESTGEHMQHYFPDRPYLYITVEAGSSFQFAEELTASQTVASQYDLQYYYDFEDLFARCVDLEGGPFNQDYNPFGHRAVFKNP